MNSGAPDVKRSRRVDFMTAVLLVLAFAASGWRIAHRAMTVALEFGSRWMDACAPSGFRVHAKAPEM